MTQLKILRQNLKEFGLNPHHCQLKLTKEQKGLSHFKIKSPTLQLTGIAKNQTWLNLSYSSET